MAFVMSLDTLDTWFPFCLDEYWCSDTIERRTVEVSESLAFIASLIPDLTLAKRSASASSSVDVSVEAKRGHAGAFVPVHFDYRENEVSKLAQSLVILLGAATYWQECLFAA
jgi:hypothetical protein